uniref:Transmembrane protein n=1 Tax=Cacopsylla melanoneura TaxID=428564 RepID=A0A8D8YMH9_9HEMI
MATTFPLMTVLIALCLTSRVVVVRASTNLSARNLRINDNVVSESFLDRIKSEPAFAAQTLETKEVSSPDNLTAQRTETKEVSSSSPDNLTAQRTEMLQRIFYRVWSMVQSLMWNVITTVFPAVDLLTSNTPSGTFPTSLAELPSLQSVLYWILKKIVRVLLKTILGFIWIIICLVFPPAALLSPFVMIALPLL